MAQFRFETLEIWQMVIDLGDELCDIADNLEKRKYISKEYKKICLKNLHISARR